MSPALCPAFVPKEPVTNYCRQREKQLGLRGAVTMHPPAAAWWDPGRQSSVEGVERVLPSSHTHTSRAETIPLPESRDPSGERGILASLQPKGVIPLWALQAGPGRFWGALSWVTLDLAVVSQPCPAAPQGWRGSTEGFGVHRGPPAGSARCRQRSPCSGRVGWAAGRGARRVCASEPLCSLPLT